MAKSKDLTKPKEKTGKIKVNRIFLNKTNGQLTVILPKKKMKFIPTKLEIKYW